jgi:hypothetical protein
MSLYACENDSDDFTGYLIKYEVTGNCPVVYVEAVGQIDYDDFFYTLNEGIPFSKEVNPGLGNGKEYVLSLKVYKHTDDASSVTANIYVDNVLVATQTSTAAYAQVEAKYTIRN